MRILFLVTRALTLARSNDSFRYRMSRSDVVLQTFHSQAAIRIREMRYIRMSPSTN